MRPIYRPAGTVGGSVPEEGRVSIPRPGQARPTVALLCALLGAGPAAAQATGVAPEGAAPDDPAPIEVSESLTVTGTRLRDRAPRAGGPERTLPAHVTVLEREEIERAAARTLQDLLAVQAGVILFDEIGDDVSKTFDLRGFGGSGTRVFLNGAPLNDPRNNSLALELVPLAQLERIEITRGSTAALAGGGSEAGVINLWTRRGGSFEGSLAVATGDFGTLEAGGSVAGRSGATDLALTGSLYDTDGFRQNAAGELARLGADLGWDLGANQRLDLSLVAGAADFGNPGALTVAEYRADPGRSPFNALDFTDETFTQAALNLASTPGERWSLAVNLFGRDRGTEALTTGRAAPAFGGFFLDADTSVIGSTVQLGRGGTESGGYLTLGLEWLEGDTDAAAFGTPPGDLARVSPAGLASRNTTERRSVGLYLQERWQIASRLTLTAGARYDRDQVAYREDFPDPVNDAAREFSELSLRAGLAGALGQRHSLFASFGEGFLPPTVEELFSFPMFGSNPGLRPEASSSLEVGFRGRWKGGRDLDLTLFRVDTEDEIVFDPDSPLGLFGANVNVGEARRRGLEASARVELGERLRGFANLTLMEAEFRNGVNAGNSLPLVPRRRLALGLDADLPLALDLRAVALRVGDQVLDNDDANAAGRLDGYTVVNARLSWSQGALGLYLDARNLFDERYASRGIFAFDFQTFTNETFVTPAPGRRLMGGLEWRF